jgi:phosphate/sulfate permease
MKIINLLPIEILTSQNISLSLSMVFALLFTAIIWNLGTWYFGLPASSSHTLIGSIMGVVLAYTYITGTEFTGTQKIIEIGMALLLSPLFGFLIAILLMLLLRFIVKSPSKKRLEADVEKGSEEDAWSAESNIFKGPKDGKEPPRWIRIAMMMGSPGLAFAHGMNDGQKGIGLMMLVLIGLAPGYFAIDSSRNPTDILPNIKATTALLAQVDSTKLSTKMQEKYGKTKHFLADLETELAAIKSIDDVPREKRFEIRKNIILAEKNISKMIESGDLTIDAEAQKSLGKEASKMKVLTDYAPMWVLILISLSLGVGTTVGWRRVVVTIGEKIGKNSLSYAQGFTADFMAAITVGLSTYFGLPVSTTHVLSSSVAGGFVAQRGTKNLNKGTLRNIMLAWVLTLPVTIMLSGGLYLLFRAML